MNSMDLYNELIEDIKSGNVSAVESKISELDEEQLNKLFTEAQPYKALGTASTDRSVIASISNLREKYLKKLITTTMVSFLFQMKEEYNIDEDELTNVPNKEDFMEDQKVPLADNVNVENIYNDLLATFYKSKFPESKVTVYKEMEDALEEDDLLQLSISANDKFESLSQTEKKLNALKYDEAIVNAIDEQSESERKVIDKFLKKLFKYNKDKHVQCGEHANVGDPERADLEELKGTDPVYDNIPPNDIHCYFNSYYEINYEKMREATMNIYNVKPDLEQAVIIYDVVDDKKGVDDFIHKYGSTSKYDIISFPLNQWTLVAPFKENRERVDYYDKNNSIIKSMLDQQEKDAALGEELMKNRIKAKKTKAEKVFGKDSPAFDKYRKFNPSELETKYGVTLEDVDENHVKVSREVTVDANTGEELKVDEDGVPDNALEVPITTINARTGTSSQTRMFTQSKQ
jgi:hypothetical protein